MQNGKEICRTLCTLHTTQCIQCNIHYIRTTTAIQRLAPPSRAPCFHTTILWAREPDTLWRACVYNAMYVFLCDYILDAMLLILTKFNPFFIVSASIDCLISKAFPNCSCSFSISHVRMSAMCGLHETMCLPTIFPFAGVEFSH